MIFVVEQVEGKLPSYFWAVATAFLSLAEALTVASNPHAPAAIEEAGAPDGTLHAIPFDAREEILLCLLRNIRLLVRNA